MVNIATNAYQVKDSLLAGGESVKVDALLSVLNLTSSYSQSDKLSSDHSVNILAQQPAKTLADVSAKIYANQSGEYFLGQSVKHFANLKRGEFTPFAKGDFSHLSKIGKSRYLNSFISKNGKIEFFESIKKGNQSATLGNVDIEYRASENYQHSDHFVIGKGNNLELIQKCAIHHLRLWVIVGYSKNALAKSSVRICTLNPYKATHDAPSVFFCVYAYAYLRFAVLYRPNSMVMLAGQPKGWLVSLYASSANPVSVTTPIEICTSGGDSLAQYKEIIVMMATPTQTQFKFLFLSIKRSDTTAKPCRIAVTASNEHDARLMLVRDYILLFAGRLPGNNGRVFSYDEITGAPVIPKAPTGKQYLNLKNNERAISNKGLVGTGSGGATLQVIIENHVANAVIEPRMEKGLTGEDVTRIIITDMNEKGPIHRSVINNTTAGPKL